MCFLCILLFGNCQFRTCPWIIRANEVNDTGLLDYSEQLVQALHGFRGACIRLFAFALYSQDKENMGKEKYVRVISSINNDNVFEEV